MQTHLAHVFPAVSLALGVLLLAACPDDSGSTNPDTAADATTDTAADTGNPGDTGSLEEVFTTTRTTFCASYATTYCSGIERCSCDDIPGFPDDCVAAFTSACEREFDDYRDAVLGGQAIARPDAVPACMTAFTKVANACVLLPQDAFFVLCPILEPVGQPLPGADEACQGPCAPGYRCSSDGFCRAPGQANAVCTSPRDCDFDLVCVDGSCIAPRHEAVGQSCAPNETCAGDTTCQASSRKRCIAPTTSPDGACDNDTPCAADRYCATDPMADPGTPGACVARPGDGEPCGNGIQCAAGLACSFDSGLCAPIPVRGERCALGEMGPSICAEGLLCVNDQCDDPPGEGEPCAIGSPPCAAGLGCSFEAEASICRAKRPAGEACENDTICQDGLFCNFNRAVCEAERAIGETCRDGNECGDDGACLPDEAFVFRCAPRPGAGDACFLDECSDGLLCRTPYESGLCVPVFCQMFRF